MSRLEKTYHEPILDTRDRMTLNAIAPNVKTDDEKEASIQAENSLMSNQTIAKNTQYLDPVKREEARISMKTEAEESTINPYGGLAGGLIPLMLLPFVGTILRQITKATKKNKMPRGRGKASRNLRKELRTQNGMRLYPSKAEVSDAGLMRRFGDILTELDDEIEDKSGGKAKNFFKKLMEGITKAVKLIGPKLLDIGLPILEKLATTAIESKFMKKGGFFMSPTVFKKLMARKDGGAAAQDETLRFGNLLSPMITGLVETSGHLDPHVSVSIIEAFEDENMDELMEPVFGGRSRAERRQRRAETFRKMRSKLKSGFSKLMKSETLKNLFKSVKPEVAKAVKTSLESIIDTGIEKAFKTLEEQKAPPVLGRILETAAEPVRRVPERVVESITERPKRPEPEPKRPEIEPKRPEPKRPELAPESDLPSFEDLSERLAKLQNIDQLQRELTEVREGGRARFSQKAQSVAELIGSGSLFAPGPFGSGNIWDRSMNPLPVMPSKNGRGWAVRLEEL
jgi:hypothetical protein